MGPGGVQHSEAGVANIGTAESFLKVAHLTRTLHAHQVTAMSLQTPT